MFEHARLRVGAVQQRDLGKPDAFAIELPDLLDDERGLVHVRRRLVYTQLVAAALRRPQVLAEAVAVVLDQRVGRLQDVAHASGSSAPA